MLDSHG